MRVLRPGEHCSRQVQPRGAVLGRVGWKLGELVMMENLTTEVVIAVLSVLEAA